MFLLKKKPFSQVPTQSQDMKDLKIIASDRDLICLAFVSESVCVRCARLDSLGGKVFPSGKVPSTPCWSLCSAQLPYLRSNYYINWYRKSIDGEMYGLVWWLLKIRGRAGD